MKKIITSQLIEGICATLACSQRVVANLLGLEPHTLSNNRTKFFEELTPRTQKRLSALYLIVVQHLGILRAEAIYEILQAHVFPDLENRMDSVVSALQQDKYPPEVLIHIADLARKAYEQKTLENTVKLPNVASALSA